VEKRRIITFFSCKQTQSISGSVFSAPALVKTAQESGNVAFPFLVAMFHTPQEALAVR